MAGRSIITSFEETREFMTGTMGATIVVPITAEEVRLASDPPHSDNLSSVGLAGLPPDPFSLMVAEGSNEFMLDVVVVAVIQVLTLGWMIPVGFIPTWGFVIGPHMLRGVENSVIHSLMADFKARRGW